MITRIVDHALRALGRLLIQFRGSPRLQGLIIAISAQVQALEDAFFDLGKALRDVDTAPGSLLDSIGALVGGPTRGPRLEAAYRGRIKAQIIANRSSGDTASLYAISKGVVTAWNPGVRITESLGFLEVAASNKGTTVNDEAQARELASMLNDAAAAGVRILVVSQSHPQSQMFAFAGGLGAGFGVGRLAGGFEK